MSSGFMVVSYCAIAFYILGLLPDVSGYVAQLPNPLATTVPNLTFAVTNTSPTTVLDGTSTELSQEEQPFDFRVEYFWKAQGVAFNRLTLFKTILYDMAFAAVKDWNGLVLAAKLPAQFQITISFVGNRLGPGLLVKHVMWALEEMFDIFEEQKRYAAGNVVVDMTPIRLGVGNVQSAPSVSTPINLTDTSARGVPGATLGGTTLSRDNRAFGTHSAFALNESENSSFIQTILPNETLSSPANFNANIGKDLNADFRYRPNGATLNDAQVFNTSLKTLIKAAETLDKYDTIGPMLSTYNEMDNFTLSLVSEPFVKGKVLSWMDCINSIVGVVLRMAGQGPEGRWAEIDGFFLDGRSVTGRFCIDKGDLTRLDPRDVCRAPFPGSVGFS